LLVKADHGRGQLKAQESVFGSLLKIRPQQHTQPNAMKLTAYFALALVTLTCLITCRTQSAEPTSRKPASPSVSSTDLASNARNAIDGWHVYTDPDKSFSIEVPCDLSRTDVSAGKNVYEYRCSGDEPLSFFIISVTNVADAEAVKMRDKLAFERSIKDSFPANKRVSKMVPIDIASGIGREIIVTNTRDEMDNTRARIIMTSHRRYDVAFIASDLKALESPAAERFLSSFKPLL
jgi:hypothetical protein